MSDSIHHPFRCCPPDITQINSVFATPSFDNRDLWISFEENFVFVPYLDIKRAAKCRAVRARAMLVPRE